MKIGSTFHILVLLVVLLTFSSHSVFGRGPRATKPEVETKQSAVLLIGDHEGIDETDAQNAALLIAEELRAQGITVSDPVHKMPVSATVYRVVLRRSDEKILFRLSKEDSIGTIFIEREMLLTDIKEIASAVSRLVYAIIHQETISSSPSLVNAGVFTAIVRVKEVLAPGVRIGLSVGRLFYTVDVGGQIAGWETGFRPSSRGANCTEKDSFYFMSMSIGGRYLFNKQNVSPYVGGGLAALHAKYTTWVQPESGLIGELFGGKRCDDAGEYPEENRGIGAYGVLGIEFGRYSRYGLKLELRVDRPFFKLPNQDVMPITLGITGGFSF